MFEAIRNLNDFSGVAKVRFPDGSVFLHAAGFLHPVYRLPINEVTRFGIASGTKGFTACAILSLVDSGKISLETPVRNIVGSYPAWNDTRVTIKALLTHTSGIPDYFDEETMDDYGALWKERPMYAMTTCESFLPMFADRKPEHEPGVRFCYNNAAFVVLGLIVERLSGKTFQTACSELVLDKAGMNDSGFFRLDELPENCASGFEALEGDGFRTNQYSIPVLGGPDGGVFTTAGDMEKFWDALLGGRILKPETVQLMISPQVRENDADPDSDFYGLGLWLKRAGESLLPFLIGEDPGASFISRLIPEKGTVFTVLSNTQEGAWPAARIIRDELT